MISSEKDLHTSYGFNIKLDNEKEEYSLCYFKGSDNSKLEMLIEVNDLDVKKYDKIIIVKYISR